MIKYSHYAEKSFWSAYDALPEQIQAIADKQYQLLEENPLYPSLHLKKVGRFYSVRINDNYRALALKDATDFIWFWIGNHADYDRFLKRF